MKTAIKLYIILLTVGYSNLFAQDYEFSLNQRRMKDHISVEIWAKSLQTQTDAIGRLNLRLSYNTSFLELSNQLFDNAETDSVTNNFFADPYRTINSGFANRNGFGNITIFDDGDEIGGLNLSLSSFGSGGVVASANGRGTFVGRVLFRIIGNVGTGTATGIGWETGQDATAISNFLGDDITADVRLKSPGSFRIQGITLLAPNQEGLVLDRDATYTGFNSIFRGIGYPIFFERSVSSSRYNSPIDEDLAFLVEYDDGTGWQEIGRVVETANRGQILNNRYSSGNLGLPNSSSGNMITAAEGISLNSANFRQPLRVFWDAPNDFRERSQSVKIRVSLLGGEISESINQRSRLGTPSETDFEYPTGNYFFLNLDGRDDYLKSEESFSNPTQITATAWINPDKLGGDHIGLIVSSSGPSAPAINGLKEGAWMLYLKDGRFPAFRARENSNAGENGFFVNLVSPDPIKEADYDDQSNLHSQNWVHIAATLRDNEAYLYVNGELVASKSPSGDNNQRLLSTNHPIWVGVNPNGDDLRGNFSGGIKEVGVWRTFLTQDKIRLYTNGMSSPSDFTELDLPDDRSGLDIYSRLTGSLEDLAVNDPWQNGKNDFVFYEEEDAGENASFYPDLPHVLITSPASNAGLSNSPNDIYDIRYLGYEIGNPTDNFSRDVNLEFSLDGGSTWNFIRDQQNIAIGLQNGTSIEAGEKQWFPYLNNANGGNLRDATPYEKDVLLRATGNNQFGQTTISSELVPLTFARYLSLKKESETKLILEDHGGTAVPTDGLFFSAWIRPYRFPTEDEGLLPLISRVDSSNNIIEYRLSLSQKGTLVFEAGDEESLFSIETDSSFALLEPLKFSTDSTWSHIAFYFNPIKKEYFVFKDGFILNNNKLIGEIPISYNLPNSDSLKTFLGYSPEFENGTESLGFEGEIRELRFWEGTPFKLYENSDLSDLINFMESRQAIRIIEHDGIDTSNLIASFSFNGSPLNYKGINKTIKSDNDTTIFINYQNNTPIFQATLPYLKMVEPRQGEEIRQDNGDFRIRWVGFDYDGLGFRSGSNFQGPPSIEFSVEGGGGDEIAPYQYVGSSYWFGNSQSSFVVPDSLNYRFDNDGSDIIFAGSLDIRIADPDIDDLNQEPLEQGPIPVTIDNARFRLTGEYEIEDLSGNIRCESQIFSIIPGSNITVRVLLEGFHNGSGFEMNQIDTSFKSGGIRLHIFADENGKPGEKVAELLPTSGYEDLNPFNRNSANRLFANLNYRFVDAPEGNYWFALEQINHLPVMSRFAAPILYKGDNKSTWEIESGWDFTSWDGVTDNLLPDAQTAPYDGNYYSAFGAADITNSKTGLAYTGGQLFNSTNSLPAMIAGDVTNDGKIDSLDLAKMIDNQGTNSSSFDINQDGNINAVDRIFILNNVGKVSSLGEFNNLLFDGSSTISSTFSSTFSSTISAGEIGLLDNQKFNRKEIRNKFQDGESYLLSAEPTVEDGKVSLELFIRSTGNTFSLGQSTIAIKFDTTSLSYNSYNRGEDPYLNYLPEITYPDLSNPDAIRDIRTLELMPQDSERITLPNERISLGRMIFDITEEKTVYQFAWHKSTSIYDDSNNSLNAVGTRQDIAPGLEFNIKFISPAGGEIYGTGEKILIDWENENNLLWLEFATGDNPQESAWQRINSSPLSGTITELEYELPFQITPTNRFRLVDSETDLVLATSNIFSIENKFGQIVSPSSSSPIFRGGQVADIWFSTNGYNKVSFQFSDDGITWNDLLDDVDASAQNVKWDVPMITTALGYIRMVGENGNEIDISDRFSIVTGGLSFLRPTFNQKVQAGAIMSIQWEYKDLDKFTLQLSTDGGSGWSDLPGEQSAYLRNYSWQVGNLNTDAARLRAVIKDNIETFVIEESNIFRIGNFTSVLENSEPKVITPINDLFLQLKQAGEYNLTLYDISGDLVLSSDIYLNKGSNRVLPEVKELGQGMYFLRVRKNTEKKLYTTIKILKIE